MKDEDFEQSLDANSEFIPLGQPMGESLIATSEKIYFENASTINKQELEKDKKHLPAVAEHQEEESANQFLDVGKWKKAKDSTMGKDMETVKQQVDQIITKTKWRSKAETEEEVIADESIPPETGEDDIEDQTEQEHSQKNQS